MKSHLKLLTEPFLQFPTQTSIRVVWFTEFMGDKRSLMPSALRHIVNYGSNFSKSVSAKTIKLNHLREDKNSCVGNKTADGLDQKPVFREIWRHEALLTDLTPGKRISYRVTSTTENNESISSKTYTLQPAPLPDKPLKILLTSDHQIKPMVAANLQKVQANLWAS